MDRAGELDCGLRCRKKKNEGPQAKLRRLAVIHTVKMSRVTLCALTTTGTFDVGRYQERTTIVRPINAVRFRPRLRQRNHSIWYNSVSK